MKNYWNTENIFGEFAQGMNRVKESEKDAVWEPLKKIVPKEQQEGFMYMGKYKYSVMHPNGQTYRIETYDYKHGITRKYLHISSEGNCYCNWKNTIDGITLKPCSKEKALDIVYDKIDVFGATKETKYDKEYKYDRNKALVDSGFTILNVSPGKIKKKTKYFDIEQEY